MKGDEWDPKALIREAYCIEGISDAECRSVFLDWALSLPEAKDPRAAIDVLLGRHGAGNDDHPMTKVLRDGLRSVSASGRRGGRSGRSGRSGRLSG